jgi:hypothetical protein
MPLLLKTVSMARASRIREAEDKHLIAHEGYPCEILSRIPYGRSFSGLADFMNRVSYEKASSADPRKRKAHPHDTAPHKRSSSPATGEIVTNGNAHPERPIANNAAHNFIWTSGLEYSNSTGEGYFEWFTIPKVDIGMHTIASICPAFEKSNFSDLRKALGYGFAFMAGKAGKFRRAHQGVLMIEIIKHSYQRRTIYQKLESLLAQSVDTILEMTGATSSLLIILQPIAKHFPMQHLTISIGILYDRTATQDRTTVQDRTTIEIELQQS